MTKYEDLTSACCNPLKLVGEAVYAMKNHLEIQLNSVTGCYIFAFLHPESSLLQIRYTH